jgi:hypothetical protein
MGIGSMSTPAPDNFLGPGFLGMNGSVLAPVAENFGLLAN